MHDNDIDTAQPAASPSVKDCRKLELVAMMAGSNELAAEELRLLLKLQQPEVLGRCRELR